MNETIQVQQEKSVLELACEIEQMRLEMGLSTEELLASLREERERYYAEKYADDKAVF